MFGLFQKKKIIEESGASDLEWQDRRDTERRNVYADAVAISNNGRFLKKGIALDLSANGSRLRFENGDSLVDGMVVSIARYGIKRPARMRWRTRTDVGIEFIEDAE